MHTYIYIYYVHTHMYICVCVCLTLVDYENAFESVDYATPMKNKVIMKTVLKLLRIYNNTVVNQIHR